MRVFLIISICVLLSAVGMGSAFFPHVLADNEFLKGFVNHEVLSLLVVILTITFASVANIHLAISRTQTNIRDAGTRENIARQFARPLQAETRSSAWLLFWAFVVCAVAVVIKGQFPDNLFIRSMTHGTALIVVFINAAVLHDIYGTIFELVGVGGVDGQEADYTDGSPPAG